MGRQPDHNPLERLNEHHGDDLLTIARAFGGYPDAVSARVEAIRVEGIDITVETAKGQASAHVSLAEAVTESGSVGVPTRARAAPLWRRFGGGCNPDRDTRTAIEAAGFVTERCRDLIFAPNWMARLTAPHILGRARRA
jgi:hypothetical protein